MSNLGSLCYDTKGIVSSDAVRLEVGVGGNPVEPRETLAYKLMSWSSLFHQDLNGPVVNLRLHFIMFFEPRTS